MTAPVKSLIVMGLNDHLHCLTGWYVREFDGRNGVCYRWSQPEATFQLHLLPQARTLRLLVCGVATLTGAPFSFSLFHDGRRFAHFSEDAPSDYWKIVETPIPQRDPLLAEEPLLITLRSERAVPGTPDSFEPLVFIPDRYLRNGDPRPMGIMVAAIRAR